jgi:hypothetical protein
VPTVFSKDRDRLLEGGIAAAFMTAVLTLPWVQELLSDELSVDGTPNQRPGEHGEFPPQGRQRRTARSGMQRRAQLPRLLATGFVCPDQARRADKRHLGLGESPILTWDTDPCPEHGPASNTAFSANPIERAIRTVALGRKSSLLAGSDAGADRWAILASLIETAKLNNVEPYALLRDALTKMVEGHPMQRLDELLPWTHA